MSKDDEPKRITVASTPLGSSSFFDEQWSALDKRLADQHVDSAERVSKTAREWRAEGFAIPEYVPDGARLTDVAQTENGVRFANSWGGAWGGEQVEQLMQRYKEIREREDSDADAIADDGSCVREAFATTRDFGTVDSVPDDELRRLSRLRMESVLQPPDPTASFEWYTDGIDRYMTLLARSIRIPAEYLGVLVDTREHSIRLRERMPVLDIDAERFKRHVLLKQWRMQARRWLTLRAPIKRFIKTGWKEPFACGR